MVFPGLTQPISIPRDSPKDRTKYTFPKMYELEDIPEEKEGTKLKREYPKDTPEERGYTGKSLAGKKRGPPAPVDGCKSQLLRCFFFTQSSKKLAEGGIGFNFSIVEIKMSFGTFYFRNADYNNIYNYINIRI